MTEMERAYGSWPLGQEREFRWVWGAYQDGAEDDMDCGAEDVSVSFQAWQAERTATDEALGPIVDLGVICDVNGRSVRWNLSKLVGEYSRHNGHADMLRERIDGSTGE